MYTLDNLLAVALNVWRIENVNNFIFENSTKVFFGKGCVKEFLGEKLGEFGENVMLAYGGNSVKKNGIYDEIVNVLEKSNKTIVEFAGIMPNPTYKKVMEGAETARANNIDLILALGGGSVMDCCKAISLATKYDGDVWADYWEKSGDIDFEPLPLGAIVTVSGTGSECNGGAVITNEEKKIKTGRDYPKCNPKFAFLDPEYTFTVSALQTASGGFDILSHIMETYFSFPDENNVSDDISEALMKSVIKNLPIALKNPKDYEARSNLMWASTMGENRIIKLGKKCDFQAHQIEHQLGAYTDCNHGCGLAAIHSTYYRKIYEYGIDKFMRFAKNVWNINPDGKSDDDIALLGIDALENFIKEIGLPTSLRELGISDRSILLEIANSCNISAGSYRNMSKENILEILNECF